MILLQVGMGSPGTHFVTNHESQFNKNESEIENLSGGAPLCNRTVNLKTDSKTLYYSLLEF